MDEQQQNLTPVQRLALTFPTLQDAPGVAPWNPAQLDAWACGPAVTHGSSAAARFILMVWNPSADWACGCFDLAEAMMCWDSRHRAAFAAWVVADPFWP